jgi:hypothetical protein
MFGTGIKSFRFFLIPLPFIPLPGIPVWFRRYTQSIVRGMSVRGMELFLPRKSCGLISRPSSFRESR